MKTKSGMLITARLRGCLNGDCGIWEHEIDLENVTLKSVLFSGRIALAAEYIDKCTGNRCFRAIRPQTTAQRRHLSAWVRQMNIPADVFAQSVAQGRAFDADCGRIIGYAERIEEND